MEDRICERCGCVIGEDGAYEKKSVKSQQTVVK